MKITGSLYVNATLRQPSRWAASAMVSGAAASASVSTSRDFEMSQFWQKRQARLHPAVPNDSTEVPGRKWLSGFFSMGSTQNPEERPEVVSTIRSSARMRTKHKPACPSCSAQARGQTSHRIRPSSRRVHQVVGWDVVELTPLNGPPSSSCHRPGVDGGRGSDGRQRPSASRGTGRASAWFLTRAGSRGQDHATRGEAGRGSRPRPRQIDGDPRILSPAPPNRSGGAALSDHLRHTQGGTYGAADTVEGHPT